MEHSPHRGRSRGEGLVREAEVFEGETAMKTVKDIVKQNLIDGGYDGLFSKGECACQIDELFICGCAGVEDCIAGYLQEPENEDDGFVIGLKKKEA